MLGKIASLAGNRSLSKAEPPRFRLDCLNTFLLRPHVRRLGRTLKTVAEDNRSKCVANGPLVVNIQPKQ